MLHTPIIYIIFNCARMYLRCFLSLSSAINLSTCDFSFDSYLSKLETSLQVSISGNCFLTSDWMVSNLLVSNFTRSCIISAEHFSNIFYH
ncbi:hypothetical protein FKM82_028208 [Ascaphus truei]